MIYRVSGFSQRSVGALGTGGYFFQDFFGKKRLVGFELSGFLLSWQNSGL